VRRGPKAVTFACQPHFVGRSREVRRRLHHRRFQCWVFSIVSPHPHATRTASSPAPGLPFVLSRRRRGGKERNGCAAERDREGSTNGRDAKSQGPVLHGSCSFHCFPRDPQQKEQKAPWATRCTVPHAASFWFVPRASGKGEEKRGSFPSSFFHTHGGLGNGWIAPG